MRIQLLLTTALTILPLALSGCGDKKDDAKGDAKKDEKKDDKPSLMMSNDTPACRAALECCEEMVKLDNGGEATPENINLSCSGVALAEDDKTCGDFKKGYVMSIEGKGNALPDACK